MIWALGKFVGGLFVWECRCCFWLNLDHWNGISRGREQRCVPGKVIWAFCESKPTLSFVDWNKNVAVVESIAYECAQPL